MRVASRIPASAPRVLQITKLPIFTRRTLTPLSLAPIRLPPVATVWRPHRVRPSQIAITMTTPSAQYTVEYGEPPKKRKNVSPPGVSTGNPSEMFSVIPFSRKIIPSVVMNEGTPTSTVIIPLTSPTSAPDSSPTTTASTIGRSQSVFAK